MSCRKIRRMALVATLSLAALGAQAPGSQLTFTDSFMPGPSALWNNHDGNWTSSAGQYYAQTPNDSPLTYSGLPFVLTDYTLTVTTVVGDGGIWLRSKENSPYGSYLLLVLGGANYGQGARGGSAGTSVYFATASKSGINEVPGVLTPGAPCTITVTAKGDTYAVYLNGATTPVTTYVDSSFPYGQVGLYDDQPNTATGNGFGPATSFSNFSLTGTGVPPEIHFFTPARSKAGAEVTITGTNLQLATAVTFNGTPAKFTQEYPSTKIVAIVPSDATSGPIEVTTPMGTTGFTVLP